MSVIFGKYHIKKQPLAKTDLIKMRDRLNHWEADDMGIWKNEYVGLGHLMLWNTPESLYEKLPLVSPHSGNIITADARIDNREELFLKLKITDFTVPDSTLILAAYDKYGKDCVHHLIGDFAFAIWDVNKEELFCARDHMGVKPFFYYYDSEVFIWASEMKGIKSFPEIKLELSKSYFTNIFYNLQNENDVSPFSNIYQVPPATYFIINSNIFYKKKYWDLNPNYELKLASDEEYFEEYLALIKSAIKCRVRTAFPLGTQLSGGLDSSGITSIASTLYDNPSDFHSFTNAVPGNYKSKYPFLEDEYSWTKKTSDFLNIQNLHVLNSSKDNYWDYIDTKNKLLDAPCELLSSEMIIDLINATNPLNVRSMLSGFYGDNFVTHNGRGFLRESINKFDYLSVYKHFKYSSKKPLSSATKYILKEHLGFNRINNKYSFDEVILKPEFHNQEHLKSRRDYYKYFVGKTLREQQYNEFQLKNSKRRFYFETLIGYSAKLEMRFPFIDIRLLEFCLSLPSNFHIRNGMKRYIYRKTMSNYIHSDILHNTKMGTSNSPASLIKFFDDHEIILKDIEALQKDKRFESFDFDKILTRLKESKDRPTQVRQSIGRDHIFFSLYRYILDKKQFLIFN
jgi:asparagine synthase (glutamine-hydrolysing)